MIGKVPLMCTGWFAKQ